MERFDGAMIARLTGAARSGLAHGRNTHTNSRVTLLRLESRTAFVKLQLRRYRDLWYRARA
jgi:hypothetical protein